MGELLAPDQKDLESSNEHPSAHGLSVSFDYVTTPSEHVLIEPVEPIEEHIAEPAPIIPPNKTLDGRNISIASKRVQKLLTAIRSGASQQEIDEQVYLNFPKNQSTSLMLQDIQLLEEVLGMVGYRITVERKLGEFILSEQKKEYIPPKDNSTTKPNSKK